MKNPDKFIDRTFWAMVIFIVLAILCFLFVPAKAQIKKEILPVSLIFAAGACDGLGEVLQFHYPKFKAVHTDANDKFWNPDISWKNKYKNHPVDKREAFTGSKTCFVMFTDGYHLTRGVRNKLLFAGLILKPYKGKKLKTLLTEFVVYSLAYSAGFNLTYQIIYR